LAFGAYWPWQHQGVLESGMPLIEKPYSPAVLLDQIRDSLAQSSPI
jgi:hypothetical protein